MVCSQAEQAGLAKANGYTTPARSCSGVFTSGTGALNLPMVPLACPVYVRHTCIEWLHALACRHSHSMNCVTCTMHLRVLVGGQGGNAALVGALRREEAAARSVSRLQSQLEAMQV